MAQKNLIPVTQRTKEEARQISRNGGIKSGKSRIIKKTCKQISQLILDAKPSQDLIDKLCSYYPDIPKDQMTNKVVLIDVAYQMAIRGDLKAIEFIRDTAGEAPIKRNEHEHNGKIELPVINVNYTKSETKTIEGEIIEEKGEK